MSAEKPEVKPVKLIAGVMFGRSADAGRVEQLLIDAFGAIDLVSNPYDFSFTDYYEKEMGTDLVKRFYSFEKLIAPYDLPRIKNETIRIESKFAEKGKRTVNLDPGYMEESKLVLASTKNFSHRIYLGDNIWGEITLRFERGEFVTHPWTYADYATPLAFDFFKRVRENYRRQLTKRQLL